MERWANKLNDFCHYCTGNDRKAIWRCKDRYCPFWRDRFANMEWQDNQKQILETNVR
jgi:hypothetical protein